MLVKSKTVGPWRENSYCVSSASESWLIDPGDNFNGLKENFGALLEGCNGILCTHGHFDHIGAVADFQDNYGFAFYIHSQDKRLVGQANLYRKLAGDREIIRTPRIDFFLDEQHELKLGDLPIVLHHTPGHTSGSVCLEFGKEVFTGDIIFSDAIGRVDLPGGDKAQIVKSVKYIIERFEGYQIYPGHGEAFILNSNVIDKLIEYC